MTLFVIELRKFIKGCYDKEYIDKHNKVYNDLQKQLTLDHVEISKKIILKLRIKN